VGGIGSIDHSTTKKSASRKKREIEDASYYIGLLREKETAILTEISRCQQETERLQSDAVAHERMESSYKELLNEVKDLEGTLADYSLAMEKMRSGTDPEHIQGFYQQLQRSNQDLANELDEIFLRRQRRQKETAAIEHEVSEIRKTIEYHLQQAGPEKFQAYLDLRSELQNLETEEKMRETQIKQLETTINDLESELARGIGGKIRQEYNSALEEIDRLKASILELDEDLILIRMDPDEAHEHLLRKVKEHQMRIREIDEELNDIGSKTNELEMKRAEINDKLDEVHGESSQNMQVRYEALTFQDAEISSTILSLEEAIANVAEEHEKIRSSIVELREQINQEISENDAELPSRGMFEEIKETVAFKEKHIETSQQTLLRLDIQKQQRAEEVCATYVISGRFCFKLMLVVIHNVGSKLAS